MTESLDRLDPPEQQLLLDAVDWVLGQSPEAHCCIFCGAEWPEQSAAKQTKNLRDHLERAHPLRCHDAHQQQTLEPDLQHSAGPPPSAEAVSAAALISAMQIEDLDPFDQLAVPLEAKRLIESRGGKLYWAAPDRVAHWKRLGATVVPTPEEGLPRQEGTPADGTTRANEMVLLELPPAMVETRAKVKRKLAADAPATRKEEMIRHKTVDGKKVYEAALRQGLSKREAMNLATAVERGQEGGKLTPTMARLTVERGPVRGP